MDKVGLPRGLIRLATTYGLQGRWSPARMLRRVLRPRVLVYSTVLLALCIAMLASLATRTPLKVDVVRDRAALARLVEGEQIENIYRLQVMNATEGARRYRIEAQGLPELRVASEPEVDVGPAESRWVPVRLRAPYGAAPAGSHAVRFEVREVDGTAQVSEKSVFLVPR
jgi:polyferredoxin